MGDAPETLDKSEEGGTDAGRKMENIDEDNEEDIAPVEIASAVVIDTKKGEPLEPSLYGIKPELKDKFKIPIIRDLIQSLMVETLQGQTYTPDFAKRTITSLTNNLCTAIRELYQNRYKHIVQVVIGEQKGAGVRSAIRCLWDVECDTYIAEHYRNTSLFCMITVFGIYFY